MARYRKFIDVDVLTAARQRMRHIWDAFDTKVVSFSGGKDSLATLRIAREVAEERGELPVKALFRDEELIPSAVIEFVEKVRAEPWVDLKYFALRGRGTQFVLGKSRFYTQWDPARPHLRPMPPHAITQPPEMPVFDANSADSFLVEHYPGKTAFITGIRAAESLTRYRSCVNKLNENYIVASQHPRMKLTKPLFDWQENDIFKYLHDTGGWCPLYDAQHVAGERFRVSTPLHSESAKRIGFLMKTDPRFYNQLLALFPDTAIQQRYWAEFDRDKLKLEYGVSFDGCKRYVAEMDDPEKRELASKMLNYVIGRARSDPGGYPPLTVFSWLEGGAYYKELMALTPGERERAWEKQSKLEKKAARVDP
jgi:predicted phosphoadenosine phosphosulfate sulfurtransferase